jgi:hypothetical protein
MFYLKVKKQILLTQLILKVLQFGALWFFSTIHTTDEMGEWSYSFSIIAIATTIFGLGNNISLKSNEIIKGDKLRLISLALVLYLAFCPLICYVLNQNLPFSVSVIIVILGFLELFRIQYSIYLFYEKKLFLANLLENLPLFLGIIFGIIFQFYLGESFISRIIGYTFGFSFLLFIMLKSVKPIIKSEIKQTIRHINWIKFVYLINVALLLSYDKLFLERIDASFLGVYSVNFVIITSLGFVIKYVENLIIGNAITSKEILVAKGATILTGILIILMLPGIYRMINIERYILKGAISYVLMVLPYALLELSIAQNKLYKTDNFRDKKLLIIFAPTILSYMLTGLLQIAELWIVIVYVLNIFITVGLINNQLRKSREIC